MESWLILFYTHHVFLIYLVLILIAIAEGPIISVLVGVILQLGKFDFIPAYIALMVGDIIGDTIFYYIGFYYGKRVIEKFGGRFGLTDEKVSWMEKLFHKNKHKILFISKITNGFGFSVVTLITAGIVKIPFWRYLSINLVGQLIWSGVLIYVGYFFSDYYTKIHSYFGRSLLIVVFVILGSVLFLLFRGFRNKLKEQQNQKI